MSAALIERLSGIVRAVLGRDEVGEGENFFALGGDSIRAVEVARQVHEQLGIRLEAIDVMRHPSVGALGAAIAARAPTPPQHARAPVAEGEGSSPASPLQRALYVMDRLVRRDERVVLPAVVTFGVALEPDAARAAVQALVRRHEPLRTTFALRGTDAVQVVHPPGVLPTPFRHTDARDAGGPTLAALYEAEAREPLDMEAGPLFRTHLVSLVDGSALLLSLHHAISDGFSAGVVEEDFRVFYDRVAARRVIGGGGPPPEPLPFQYRDSVRWLRAWMDGPSGARAREFWARTLDGCPTGILGQRGAKSFAAAREDGPVDAETFRRLRAVSEEVQATPFTLLHACIAVLLHLRTGAADFAVGVATTTRDSLSAARQVGPYVNTVPVRARVSLDDTLATLVHRVGEATLAALAHKLMPYEVLADELTGGMPLFDVGFTLQKEPAGEDEALLVTGTLSDPLAIPLLFVARERPEGLSLRLRYQAARLGPGEAREIREHLARVIHTLCGAPHTPVAELFGPPEADPFAVELDL